MLQSRTRNGRSSSKSSKHKKRLWSVSFSQIPAHITSYLIAIHVAVLQALSVRKHQETIQHAQDREDGQLEGMKQIKQSCQGMPLSCEVEDRLKLSRCRFCGYGGRFHEGLISLGSCSCTSTFGMCLVLVALAL